jgi:hypothetical protein
MGIDMGAMEANCGCSACRANPEAVAGKCLLSSAVSRRLAEDQYGFFAPRVLAEEADPTTATPVLGRPADAISPRRRASGLGRWDASPITFALRGRLIATVLFTLPMLMFVWYLFPFGFVGVVAYGVVYPRALRDIWTRADRL